MGQIMFKRLALSFSISPLMHWLHVWLNSCYYHRYYVLNQPKSHQQEPTRAEPGATNAQWQTTVGPQLSVFHVVSGKVNGHQVTENIVPTLLIFRGDSCFSLTSPGFPPGVTIHKCTVEPRRTTSEWETDTEMEEKEYLNKFLAPPEEKDSRPSSKNLLSYYSCYFHS